MKQVIVPRRLSWWACVAAGLAAQSGVSAQNLDAPETSGWTFRAGAVSRFNIKTELSGGSLPVDGFVQPDNSGAASGKTWNWGYTSATQYDAGKDEINIHHLDGVQTIGHQESGLADPALGGEVTAGFTLYEFTIGNRPARLGIELGYGFTTFSGDLSYNATGNVTWTTDGYKLNGVTLPVAPYSGTAAGPGPLIDLAASSHTVVTARETSSFLGQLSGDFHDLRLGPTFDIDLTRRLNLSFGAGYSSVLADTSLRYDETRTFDNPAVPAVANHASMGKTDWLPGFYANVILNYRITKHLGAFAGGDIRANKSPEFQDAGHQVKLDLGSTFGAKAGMVFWF